jgi:FkbM family methyltransferase
MARLTQKLRTLATHPDVRSLYASWLFHRLVGIEPFVKLPHGGRGYATGKFNDFYGIWVQHPSNAEFRTFAQLLGKGGVYVDVGANMGLTTIVASMAGESSMVVAFEPTHSYAATWHKNIQANNVRDASLFQCAVGERPGTFEFIINRSAPMHNRLNLGETLGRYERPAHDTTIIEKVPVTTIDAVSTALGIDRIALLKIDVEGAEPNVMRGARDMLERKAIDAIYTEFIPEFMQEMRQDVDVYVNWIYSLGYVAFRIETDGKIGHSLTTPELIGRNFAGLNVVLKPM